MTDSDKAIIEIFTVPHGYAMPADKWTAMVRDAVQAGGCDWLDHLNQRANPMPGERVRELCLQQQQAEKSLAELRELLRNFTRDAYSKTTTDWPSPFDCQKRRMFIADFYRGVFGTEITEEK